MKVVKYLKRSFVLISALLLLSAAANAEIIKTTRIQDIRNKITDNTLVLFNIAEVLMDTETSLGTQAWRKFIRSRLDAKHHDELTFFVFQKVPPKCPEKITPKIIRRLQSKGQAVLAFTSRGRDEWYSTEVPDVDIITETLLRQIGIDFSKTQLDSKLALIPELFFEYFHKGVIYTTNSKDKGELLLEIFETTGYKPSKIVFVDDKVDSLASVEKTVRSLGIPFVGYAYSKTAKDHAKFDPLIANIQLDWLITNGEVLSDKQALQKKKEGDFPTDQDQYLKEIVSKWDLLKSSLEEYN